jgi:hypothetical protein
MKIISRSEAKKKGLKYFFTGKPCKHGHIAPQYVSCYKCVKCNKLNGSAWYKDNKERHRKLTKNWRKNNIERARELDREWYYNNPDKRHQWQKDNPKKSREYQRNWRAENKDKTQQYSENHRNKKIEKEGIEEYRKKHNLQQKEWRKKNPKKAKQSQKKYWAKYYKSTVGKLRAACGYTARKLNLGKLPKSKLDYLSYNPEEFEERVLKPFNFNSLQEAWDKGYHLDHIVPLDYIARNINDPILAFKVAMDLENLQLILGSENCAKNNNIDSELVQNIIKYLWDKYGIT